MQSSARLMYWHIMWFAAAGCENLIPRFELGDEGTHFLHDTHCFVPNDIRNGLNGTDALEKV